MAKQISTLPVGSIVKSPNTKYNGSVIRFIIGDHDSGRTKLLTEKIISIKPYDGKEPSNSNSSRKNAGNNRYMHSNIAQWLNSQASAGEWYSPQHTADTSPTGSARVSANWYSEEAGFLSNFENDFINAILDVWVSAQTCYVPDGGVIDTFICKVYLLSYGEVGLDDKEGSVWSYFNSYGRIAYPTTEAVSKSTYSNSDLSTSKGWRWFLRNSYMSTSCDVGFINSSGGSGHITAYNGNGGVRPAIELPFSTMVSDTVDVDGAYILQWNQPPTTPLNISHGKPQAGKSLTISTSGSIDPEEDTITYVWERRIDGGTYSQIGTSTDKSIVDIVPTYGTNYQSRVKAVALGGESSYMTGSIATILHNTPPVISGVNTNLGASKDPFTYNYTVSDEQFATQTLTISEVVSNETGAITIRTYEAENGAINTANLSNVWLRLSTGPHTLTITANDGAGGISQRIITFVRTINRISGSRIILTDSVVRKCFISIFPSTRPSDSVIHCEVTNNPFDSNPIWEDITVKINKYVHIFKNTEISGTKGLAYRFYISKEVNTIEVKQTTVRFA